MKGEVFLVLPGYEQYGGNLTGQTWRGRDGVQRAQGYVYDPVNRLLQGDFVARTGGANPSAGAWTQELDNCPMLNRVFVLKKPAPIQEPAF